MTSGLLVVDKPQGITSHQVVARARRAIGTKKVGHAGTLDPMATGVLVLGIGKGTRLLGHLALTTKTYTATIRLGQATDTDDADGHVTDAAGAALTAVGPRLSAALAELTGTISQVPSSVSAIKVDGQRAYARVRKGEDVQLAARRVTVSRFDALDVRTADADGVAVVDVEVVVDCSSGTYIRALARDLGDALGTGGHLTALRRTAVGPFRVEEAVDVYDGRPPAPRGERNPDPSADLVDRVAAAVLAPPQALGRVLPTRTASSAEAHDIAYGRPIPAAGRPGVSALLDPTGARLLALVREQGEVAKPVLVFAPAT